MDILLGDINNDIFLYGKLDKNFLWEDLGELMWFIGQPSCVVRVDGEDRRDVIKMMPRFWSLSGH